MVCLPCSPSPIAHLRNVILNERPLSESAVTCLGPVHRAEWVVDYRGELLGREQRHAQRKFASSNKAGGGRGRRALERKAAC